MNLSDTIHRLRIERGMSQDALADHLEVSRQSVSKWETGNAVPDLDKLMKMSDLFGVTLDELVKGAASETREPEPGPKVIYVEQVNAAMPRRKIIGYALCGFALLTILLCTILGSPLGGLVLSIPFWVCGAICFLFQQRVGLWCAWALLFLVDTYLRFATGVSWGSLFSVIRGFIRNDAAIVVSVILYALVILLIWATVHSYREKLLEPNRKVRVRFGVKLALLALCSIPWPMALLGQRIAEDGQMLYRFARTAQILSCVLQWGKLLLLTILLIELFAILRWKKQNSASE